jgi:hypothetical protein
MGRQTTAPGTQRIFESESLPLESFHDACSLFQNDLAIAFHLVLLTDDDAD